MASFVPLVGLLAMAGAAPSEAPTAAIRETSVITGLGWASGQGAGGVGFTLMATHRFRFVELGLDGQAAAFVSRMAGVGAVGGLHLGEDFSLRLLGSAGVHTYGAVGKHLLSDDPGVSGTVPYAGGRVVLGYSFPARSRPHRAFIGLLGGMDQDLARKQRAVTYIDEDWLFGGRTEQTSIHSVGQLTISGFVVAGVDLDLVGY